MTMAATRTSSWPGRGPATAAMAAPATTSAAGTAMPRGTRIRPRPSSATTWATTIISIPCVVLSLIPSRKLVENGNASAKRMIASATRTLVAAISAANPATATHATFWRPKSSPSVLTPAPTTATTGSASKMTSSSRARGESRAARAAAKPIAASLPARRLRGGLHYVRVGR